MAYQIVNGTNNSNLITYVGIMGFYNQTLVNPYTGYTITITGNKNINNGIYDGMNGTDSILMTVNGEVLTLADAAGTIMIKNIENLVGNLGDDVFIISHSTFTYGNIVLRGGDGNDLLWGNVGNDTFLGSFGADIIEGGPGDDRLYGGEHNDYLSGWLGKDSLFGGSGEDTFIYNVDDIWTGGYTLSSLGSSAHFSHLITLDGKNLSYDTFHGDTDDLHILLQPREVDTLILTSGNDALVGSDTISPSGEILTPRIEGVEIIQAGDGDDVVDLSGLPYVDVTIDGGSGNDALASSNGNDTLIGGTGDDMLSGGTGNDTYFYNLGDGSDTIYETSGTDSITFGPGIAFSNLTLAKVGNDVHITIGGELLTIVDHFGVGHIESLVFDDNSTFDLAGYGLNVNPTAVDDVFSGNEDEEITGNVLDNDSDDNNDMLTVTPGTFVTSAGGSVLLNADGTFSYQGISNFHGTDGFSYTLNDGQGGTGTANVILHVASINDTPVALDESFNLFRNASVMGNVLTNDSDIDGGTLSVGSQTLTTANGGTVVLNTDGSFTYTPAEDFFGDDSFDYTLLDGQGGTDTATVSLAVELDPAYSIIGTSASDVLSGTEGNDEIFGLGCPDIIFGENGHDEIYGGTGNDVVYGDDGIFSGVILDKDFSDTVVFPGLKEGTNIANLKPAGTASLGVANNNLSVDFDATATITFKKGYAGYDNSFGSFGIAADGTIVSADMLWANVKTAGINTAHQIDIPVGAQGGEFGFFIIGNGNVTNAGYTGLNVTGDGNLSFIYNYGKSDQRAAKVTDLGSKISLVYNDGVTTKVLQGSTFFTTDRGDAGLLNRDGKVHMVSGLMDANNLNLDMVAADLATKPQSFTKNGFTVSAIGGVLIADGNKFGVKSADSVKRVSGDEAVHLAVVDGAEKMTFGLSFITGGNTAIDFKIYMNGDTTPIIYEHIVTGPIVNGLYDIALYASQFGPGVITGVEISPKANSSYDTEVFYINTLSADIPGGVDEDTLRIGFEDIHGTGDADYEDVLFDLNINSVNLGDIHGGNDILDGGAGNDTLYGEGGDDILVISLDADTVFGGKGADVFAITHVDGQIDSIMDFNTSEGDKINVADVLQGYDPLSDDIAHFVRLTQNGTDIELQINQDGDLGGAFVTAAIIIGDGDGDLSGLLNGSVLIANQSALA